MYYGLDGQVSFIGVVENRNDPLNAGRVQVRIWGWHSIDKGKVPTEDLPWAEIRLSPNDTQRMHTLIEGDWVDGYFRDGEGGQVPVVTGFLPGIPEEVGDQAKGFSDPRNSDQLQASPAPPVNKTYHTDGSGITFENQSASRNPSILNESTFNRIAKNVEIQTTFIQERLTNRVENIPKGSGTPQVDGGIWSEPATTYNARPPLNKEVVTESGHVIGWDDTPGVERIQIAHRSGSFVEFYPDGSVVVKTTKSKYEIVMSDSNLLIMGDGSITVNGNQKILVKGDAELQVDGDASTQVSGTWTLNAPQVTINTPSFDLNNQ